MGYWATVIEVVSTMRLFVITGDGRLGKYFFIDGRLGKGDIISLKNPHFCYHMGWNMWLGFWDRWEIGQWFSYVISLNNQQFRDHRIWVIGMGVFGRWKIGQGFSDGSSLNNQIFYYHRDWYNVIDGILGKGDRCSLKNQKIYDHMWWDNGLGLWDRREYGKAFSDRSSLNNKKFDTYIGIWLIEMNCLNNKQSDGFSDPLFQWKNCVGEKSGTSWLLKNHKFDTFQLHEPLTRDRVRTVSEISRW